MSAINLYQAVKQPKQVTAENYFNLSQPAGGRSQYIRSFQDHTPVTFRRYVNASGVQDVQIKNPVAHTTRKHVLYSNHGYLQSVAPVIPGQMRDNFGGQHKRGIDPLSYDTLWNAGPGSQPANPGGPGQIAAPSFFNPGLG